MRLTSNKSKSRVVRGKPRPPCVSPPPSSPSPPPPPVSALMRPPSLDDCLTLEEQFAAARHRYVDVLQQIARGATWAALPAELQHKMDLVAVMWERCADQGLAIAQFNLGTMFEHGQGVPKDYRRALLLYERAADQGDAHAQYNLALLYEQGTGGVKVDLQRAVQLYRKAADQSVVGAWHNLAYLHEHGYGLPQDDCRAAQLYQLASSEGLAEAQYNLGRMTAQGRGVPQDVQRAMQLFQQAADQGDVDARAALALLVQVGQQEQPGQLEAPPEANEARSRRGSFRMWGFASKSPAAARPPTVKQSRWRPSFGVGSFSFGL